MIASIMNDNYCQYCWPTKRRNHIILYCNYYIDNGIAAIERSWRFFYRKHNSMRLYYFWGMFLELLAFFRIVRFVSDPETAKLYNRSLIFFEEAQKRNLNIQAVRVFGQYVHEFKFIYKNKKYYYQGIPLTVFKETHVAMDDKNKTKKLLQKNNIPIAHGELFTNIASAKSYGLDIGFPLVVKPFNGSLSHHVICPITSEEGLVNAIRIAKKYTPAFIVERYVAGNMFRVSVVDKKYVFVCEKDKANVVGDGHATIAELIRLKNAHSYRGNTDQMNRTLHKIPINDVLMRNLQQHGLHLHSVLPPQQKIYLHDKFVLSHGCDIINCTKLVHDKNKELFLRVADMIGSDLIGIDFICPDIRMSYEEQTTAILETNSLPYIDMHQYPSHGIPEPIAEIVWDVVLQKLVENK